MHGQQNIKTVHLVGKINWVH